MEVRRARALNTLQALCYKDDSKTAAALLVLGHYDVVTIGLLILGSIEVTSFLVNPELVDH